MIGKLALLLLAGVVICEGVTELELKSEFAKFMTTYARNYQSSEEVEHRFEVFSENYQAIVEFNEQRTEDSDEELGVNQFADMTLDEIKDAYLSYKPSRFPCKAKHKKIKGDPSINWVNKGKVGRVKNQGNCGSCWAFSAMGAIESLHAIANGTMIYYSEQELVDCSRKYGDNEGCNGGDMCQAFDYIKDNGISLESEYRYEARDRPCRKKSKAFIIRDCVNVTQLDSDELLEALAWGPVSVAVMADNPQFMYYRRGIIKTGCVSAGGLDHGILLVGAGNEESTDYWLVKNSWGASWGLSGYAKIKRDTGRGKGMCGIAMENSYPVL